jgi:hypothetical protein
MAAYTKIDYKTQNTREKPDKSPDELDRLINPGNFFTGDNVSDNLANNHFQVVDIYHIPSGRSVSFKAAITNFNDSYQAQWNRNEVYGRMDPIGTYKRTTRQIQIGISVMASSFQEAEENFQRISLLVQMHYPSFGTDGRDNKKGAQRADSSPTLRGGPLWKMRFLNWVGNGSPGVQARDTGLLGWSDGISYVPNLEMGVFQDGLNIYPKNYEISLSFTVVHENQLGWDYTKRKKIDNGQTIKKPLDPQFPYGTNISDTNLLPNPVNANNEENKDKFDQYEKANVKKILEGE